jgi:hypothetical protein
MEFRVLKSAIFPPFCVSLLVTLLRGFQEDLFAVILYFLCFNSFLCIYLGIFLSLTEFRAWSGLRIIFISLSAYYFSYLISQLVIVIYSELGNSEFSWSKMFALDFLINAYSLMIFYFFFVPVWILSALAINHQIDLLQQANPKDRQ